MDGGCIFFIKKVHKKLDFLFLMWYNVFEDKEKDGLKQNKQSAVNLNLENYRQQKQDEAIKTNTKNNTNNTKKTTQTIQNNKNYRKIIGKLRK